jgi:hypothetical protein
MFEHVRREAQRDEAIDTFTESGYTRIGQTGCEICGELPSEPVLWSEKNFSFVPRFL